MIFKPLPCKTRWEGLFVSFWILLIDCLLLIWLWQRAIDWLKYGLLVLLILSVPVLIHLLYRVWGAFTLTYWVDRNAVTIRWGNLQQIIPLSAIQRIIQGGANDIDRQQWAHWPSPYVRQGYSQEARNVQLLATRPLSECLLLVTEKTIFAISPETQAAFIETVQDRYRMGQVAAMNIVQLRTSLRARLFGEGDMGPALLGMGLVGVLVLFGILMVQFPDLPSPLPIRYTSDGLPEVLQEKTALFRLPVIGLAAWVVNGLWGILMIQRQQSIGAYLLWGGAALVQVFLLLALYSILP